MDLPGEHEVGAMEFRDVLQNRRSESDVVKEYGSNWG